MNKEELLEQWRANLESLELNGTMEENRDKLEELVNDYDEIIEMEDEGEDDE